MDLDKHIPIPTTKLIIDFEQRTNGYNFNDTHLALAENNLVMSETYFFMKHFVNVINHYKQGKRLKFASGKPLTSKQMKDIYNKLTENCWVWLNNGFTKSFWTS